MRKTFLLFIFFVFTISILAPLLTPYSPYEQNVKLILLPPSPEHPFGTDQLGRDLMTRVLYGGRITFLISVSATIISLFLGTLTGTISGYIGRTFDIITMRILDGIYSFPELLIIILLTVLTGRSPLGIIASLTLTSWVVVARIVRGETIRLKNSEMVEGAYAIGSSHIGIILKYILPNIRGVLIALFIIRVPGAILAESVLSFLGLGLSPPASSWGILVNEGWGLMFFSPHLVIFPLSFIFLSVLSLYMTGREIEMKV